MSYFKKNAAYILNRFAAPAHTGACISTASRNILAMAIVSVVAACLNLTGP